MKISILICIIMMPAFLFGGSTDDLHKAIEKKSVWLISKALKAGADINGTDEEGRSPVMKAAKTYNWKVFKAIMDKNPDLTLKDNEGNTIAHYGAKSYSGYIIKTIFNKNVDFTQKNNSGDTPLIVSIRSKSYYTMKFLVDKKITLEVADRLGRKPIIIAYELKNSRDMYYLMKAGVSLSARGDKDYTILHLCVLYNDYRYLGYILKEKIDINAIGSNGKTALIIAAEKNLKYITKVLLTKEPDAKKIDEDGKNVLHYLAKGYYYWYIPLAVKLGAQLDTRDKKGKTPLHYAIESRRTSNVKALLKDGANPNIADDEGLYPIHRAYINRSWAITSALLGKKANLDKKMPDGKTLLVDSIIANRYSFAKHFLQNGANTEIKSPDGKTPLVLVVEKNRYHIIYHLLKAKANVNIPDPKGILPIVIAVEKTYAHMVTQLVNAGASINSKDPKGRSLLRISNDKLMQYFTEYRSKLFMTLIKKGANVNITVAGGKSLLHAHVEKGYTYYTGLIIEHKADIKKKDSDGNSTMHLAVQSGKYAMVKLLINKKIPVNDRGPKNYTPIMYAIQNNYTSITKLLLANGAGVNVSGTDGITPAHLAVRKQNIEILRALIEKKANLNRVNKYGNSLIMESCKAESYQTTKSTYRIIHELLKGGANINFKNKYGNTPLMYAINRKNYYLVSYLLSKGADPLMTDGNGKNALKKVVLSAVYDSLKNDSLRFMLYTILQSKAAIDGKDKNGTTALMEAVKSGLDKDSTAAFQVASILLDFSADINHRDSYSKKATDYADNQSNYSIKYLLRNYGKDLGTTSGFATLQLGDSSADKIYDIAYFNNNLYCLADLNGARSLVKVDSYGAVKFQKKISNGVALAMDADGAIYVAGRTLGKVRGRIDKTCEKGKNYVLSVIKYNNNGRFLWQETYGYYKGCNKTRVINIILDKQKNVYVAANFGSAKYNSMVKINNKGKYAFHKWAYGSWSTIVKTLDSVAITMNTPYIFFYNKYGTRAGGRRIFKTKGTTVFYNTGEKKVRFYYGAGKLSNNKGYFIEKRNWWGKLLWYRAYSSGDKDIPVAIVEDQNNGFYLVGHTQGSLHGYENKGGYDCFIMKFDINGNKKWTRLIGSSKNDIVKKVVLSGNGTIVISGTTTGGLKGNFNRGKTDIFLLKVGSDGRLYER